MGYAAILQDLPQEQRLPLLKLVEAVEQNIRDQLAVRREDFQELSEVVRGLIEGQNNLEQRMAELAAAQKRTEQTLAELIAAQKRTDQTLAELIAAQKRTDQTLAELIAAQKRTDQTLEALLEAQRRNEERFQRVTDQISDLRGRALETEFQTKVGAFFGPLLRQVRSVSIVSLEDEIEPRLSEADFNDLLRLDLLVAGVPRHRAGAPDVYLAVEVSAVVDRNDVDRALRRAGHLRRAGLRVVPVAAGQDVTRGAEETAAREAVVLLQDGRTENWEPALASCLSA